ncbi:hypothetical protein JAAARDRAFT_134046 [Jaapia argillacea MUCL 33604]|uniref:CMP/dCMP-type deaminase domain-containing protein n=1 Tax=Jaapia argillacea MUCL 33604 TaxID=933084 RepID=A0A067PYU5_9AGAM|nr:hypothetical protein JAAARDRAFT_134046 [Jaapia argillacea MUCL 33604]
MANHSPETLVATFLDAIETSIIPLTAQRVSSGSKVFGAAVFKTDDLSLVLAETNNEAECPLWHGEVHTIKKFYEMPNEGRPKPKDCIFFTTHEPCSLCLSAITWAGFPNFYYLYTYDDTRDAFGIPYDIEILEEVYRVPTPNDTPESLAQRPLYNKTNKFFKSASLAELGESVGSTEERERIKARLKEIKKKYDDLSTTYQAGKGSADIPLA